MKTKAKSILEERCVNKPTCVTVQKERTGNGERSTRRTREARKGNNSRDNLSHLHFLASLSLRAVVTDPCTAPPLETQTLGEYPEHVTDGWILNADIQQAD